MTSAGKRRREGPWREAARQFERYPCLYCGCDVTSQRTIGGDARWVDTCGSALCPGWQATFHAVNPVEPGR